MSDSLKFLGVSVLVLFSGLSLTSISAWTVGQVTENVSWTLLNYFQAVFGSAGLLVGVITVIGTLLIGDLIVEGDSSE